MSYVFIKSEISVCFYPPRDNKFERYGSWLGRTKLTHCSMMLKREDNTVLLGFGRAHKPHFVDAKGYNLNHPPCCIIPVGEYRVSLQQLCDFIKNKYIGDWLGLFLWKYLWQHVYTRHTVRTCATLVSDCLRICGHKIKIHTLPQTLYKELTNADNSSCRSCGGG